MSAADIQRPASKLKFGGLTEYRGEEFPHSNSRTVQSRVKIECLSNSHSKGSRVAALRHRKSRHQGTRVFFHRYRMVTFNAVAGAASHSTDISRMAARYRSRRLGCRLQRPS